ncbi:MAG: hypothetical protein GX207_07695 [Peptococcaceae bacterium]|nr:hypothetical protein [Peptococcaceae bacterium]
MASYLKTRGHGRGKGSFLLKILYTQNNDIQGTIQWLEEEMTMNFRSSLELMTLLSEAVSLMDEGPILNTWDKSYEQGWKTNSTYARALPEDK